MRLADFSLTPTLKDFVDLRAGIVRDYCALMRRTSRGVCVQVIDALSATTTTIRRDRVARFTSKQISNLTSRPCGIELEADLAGAHKR
jgi:hypothetical protein